MKRITTKNGYYIKCRNRKEQIHAIRTYNRYRHLRDLFNFIGFIGSIVMTILMLYLTVVCTIIIFG